MSDMRPPTDQDGVMTFQASKDYRVPFGSVYRFYTPSRTHSLPDGSRLEQKKFHQANIEHFQKVRLAG